MTDVIDGGPQFIITKEYKRFIEFCDSCRRYRYVGLCYGLPGVGKTLSARHYARWDCIEPLLHKPHLRSTLPPDLAGPEHLTLFYTAPVTTSPPRIEKELDVLKHDLARLILFPLEGATERTFIALSRSMVKDGEQKMDLLIVDEADRLKSACLEQLRDTYDRSGKGMILIGMPGIEKRLSRYPQLYSRVGFVHQFKPLSSEEMQFIFQQKWAEMGLQFRADDFTDVEAVAAIARITGGNFRLVLRLLMQVERLLQVNQMRSVTKEVVEAARECLIIGTSG